MQAFWLTFTDGSKACCEGESAYHAKKIAEKFTGKTVAGGTYDNIAAVTLPYPAHPCIWRFDDPLSGKRPLFCSTPEQCKGRGSCPKSYACTE